MAIDPDLFRAALGRFASGVTIVTTRDAEGAPNGLTVSAFCSVSLEPPIVLVCIERVTDTAPAISQNGRFAVQILDERDEALSRRFSEGLRGERAFEGVKLRDGLAGIPLLLRALAAIECRVTHELGGGDHQVFLGEVEAATIHEGHPLLHFRGGYRRMER